MCPKDPVFFAFNLRTLGLIAAARRSTELERDTLILAKENGYSGSLADLSSDYSREEQYTLFQGAHPEFEVDLFIR